MANTPTTPSRRNASVCSICGSHGHNCRTCPSGMLNDVLNSAIIKADKCIQSVPEIGHNTAYQNLYEWLETNDNSFSVGGVENCYVTNAMSILATRLRITTSITNPNRIRLLCEYLFTTRTIEKNASRVFTEYTRCECVFRNGLAYQTDIAVARLRETEREQEHTRRLQENARVRARELQRDRAFRERQRQESASRRNRERQHRRREQLIREEARRTSSEHIILNRVIQGLTSYFLNLPNRIAQIRFIERIQGVLNGNPTGMSNVIYSTFILDANLIVGVNPIQPDEYFRQLQQLQQADIVQRRPQIINPIIITVSQGVITEQECPVCYDNKTPKEMVVYDCNHGLCISCYESYLSHLHRRVATCAMCRMPLTKVYREETV